MTNYQTALLAAQQLIKQAMVAGMDDGTANTLANGDGGLEATQSSYDGTPATGGQDFPKTGRPMTDLPAMKKLPLPLTMLPVPGRLMDDSAIGGADDPVNAALDVTAGRPAADRANATAF